MLKILQDVNHEIPYVEAGFRKGRGTRDQIANIHWIMEKAEELEIKLSTSIRSQKKQENSRKTSPSGLLTMLKPLTV